MGQFEKIVVLSVIGLIAVILVVSFSGSQDPPLGDIANAAERELLDEGELHGPLPAGPLPIQGRSENLGASGPETEHAPAPDALDLRDPFAAGDHLASSDEGSDAAPVGRDQLTLSAEVSDPRELQGAATRLDAEEQRLVEGLPSGAALITLRGLEDTWEADLKQYTCQRGDALRKLAQRFYGDANMEGLLRQYNEGVELLQENQVLLIPVFDLREPRADSAAAAPTPAPTGGGGMHVVGEGENLWGISEHHYGRGSDWQRIYDANRDRLSDPDAVRAGYGIRSVMPLSSASRTDPASCTGGCAACRGVRRCV